MINNTKIIDLMIESIEKRGFKENNMPTTNNLEEIKYIIKRYTHDRSKDGYSDVLGSCGYPCHQCEKDKVFIENIINFIKDFRKHDMEVITKFVGSQEIANKELILEIIKNYYNK
jgi:hypothetical protein